MRLAWLLAIALLALPVPAPAQTAEAPVARPASGPMSERILGNPDAPVTITEHSSLTCPHCARFHADILPKLKADLIDTGKVRIVVREFPLDRMGLAAAMVARCMPEDKFFEFTDALFSTQREWAVRRDTKGLGMLAFAAGMSGEDMEACIRNKELADFILQRRLEDERAHNVRSTPTFVFNGGAATLVGAQPVEAFHEIVDKLLADRK